MLYVSGSKMQKGRKVYYITDTDDGKTEGYTEADLRKVLKALPDLEIKGITKKKVNTVGMGNAVVNSMLSSTKEQIKAQVYSWDYTTCENVARKNGFVRQIKPYMTEPDKFHEITLSRVFPDSLQEVINNAQEYTNVVQSVDVKDISAVETALRNNMCLIVQLSTTNKVTAFIGTGSLGVIDSIYGMSYFDIFFLTKNLFGYTYNIERVRTTPSTPRAKNPSMHTVISGSLRFRKDGAKHDKDNLVLSSPTYTVNYDNLIALYILDNPASMNKYNVVNEFHQLGGNGLYDFDYDLWKEVSSCLAGGVNRFKSKDLFLRYVDPSKLTDKVDLGAVMDKFDSDFNYVLGLRNRMTTL